MRCPSCNEIGKDKVIDSRLTESGGAIRRRRVCTACNRRFTTKERADEELRLSVIKKNDRAREPYRRDNIAAGVRHACYKLNMPEAQLDELVDAIEGDLFREYDREVTTEQIGQLVARRLREVNQVAYVRFMSVYRQFASVEEFVDEIQNVKEMAAGESPDQQDLFGGG